MRWLIAPILALSFLARTANAAPLSEPQIWFNPLGSPDYLNLWVKDAPWPEAARKVKVLQLVDWWVRTPANYPVLVQTLDFAKRHHMEIDLNTEPVAKFQNGTCGNGEGYEFPGDVAQSVQILANLGVRLDWVDMDEPLWFGSYSTATVDCQLSIADLITRTAQIMQEVISVYPHVKIMEIEPIPALMQVSTWRADETTFHIGLSQQLGVPVRAMMVDVEWNDPLWQRSMVALHQYLRQTNLDLNVIYDGSDQSMSDADWINTAVNNIESVEGKLQIIPEQVMFTSWNPYPSHNLPETTNTTQTWLIDRYVRPLSALQVQFVGTGANGKLTTLAGKPIPGVTVQGYKPGVNFSQPLPTTVITGVVPPTAVSALIGVRINTECGNCNGMNDLLFGAIQYQETQGGSAQMSYSYPTASQVVNGAIIGGEVVGGVTVTRVIAAPGQALVMNSNIFPVTAGAQYQFTIPAAAIGGSGWFGNVILIWIDQYGNGNRMIITPPPGKALTSTAITAPDGTFSLPLLPRSVDGPMPVTVEFDGASGAFRSTVWSPLQ